MHPAARRRRRRANVHRRERHAVLPPRGRKTSCEDPSLPLRYRPQSDSRSAAPCPPGQTRAAPAPACENPARTALPAPRSRSRHILGRPLRHVAVGPGGVLPRGRARLVEGSVGQQHERPARMRALPNVRSPPWSRPGARSRRARIPGAIHGNRTVQRPVELEHTGPIAILRKRAAKARRPPLPPSSSNCRGDTSHMTRSAAGRLLTRDPVRISPPKDRR